MRLAAMLVSIAMLMPAAAAAPVPAQPAAQAAAGEVVLLDFAASWCGPCRQMAGLIGEISAAGWLVRHVDVDRESDLVKRFGVTGVPCYVLLVKGHEVGRINGATTRAELENLLAKAAAPLGASFTFICLVTGSLWGKPMWGTWWVWEARITSTLFLWLLVMVR
jgi:thiol-disulfide isomerase/thioredoxin